MRWLKTIAVTFGLLLLMDLLWLGWLARDYYFEQLGDLARHEGERFCAELGLGNARLYLDTHGAVIVRTSTFATPLLSWESMVLGGPVRDRALWRIRSNKPCGFGSLACQYCHLGFGLGCDPLWDSLGGDEVDALSFDPRCVNARIALVHCVRSLCLTVSLRPMGKTV